MMSDGPTVLSVIDDVKGALSEGALWIDMSSTKPGEAREARALLEAADVAFLDAPVSGGTKGAEGASLAIMVGGDAASEPLGFDLVNDPSKPSTAWIAFEEQREALDLDEEAEEDSSERKESALGGQ